MSCSSSEDESAECLVCLSNAFGVNVLCKWFQCPEGHLLCETCHKKVRHDKADYHFSHYSEHDFIPLIQIGGEKPCPSCGSMIGTMRNRFLETLAEKKKTTQVYLYKKTRMD
jgi:hypothetical protein